jgi:hypothetical protein
VLKCLTTSSSWAESSNGNSSSSFPLRRDFKSSSVKL